jgi:twitching motility protein PilT
MAAIDSLLGIAEMKKASGVALASGEVPALLTGGGRTPLTMPPLSSIMLDALVAELLDEGQREQLAQGQSVETEYRTAQGSFIVKARSTGGRTTLTVRKGVASPAVPARAEAPIASLSQPRAPAAAGDLAEVLARAAAGGASDIVLSAGAPPSVRREGGWSSLPGDSLSSEQLLAFFEPLLGSRRTVFDRSGSVDLALSIPRHAPTSDRHPVQDSEEDGDGDGHRDDDDGELRLRVNLFRHAGGVAAAIRPIWSTIPTLQALHLPPALLDLVRPGSGLVLLAGPTGCGKSTTLAALLDHLNRTRACHIVTLEDPIEYRHRRRRAIVHQREVGRDVDGFSSGLRAALRERPDVLLVGEMRDRETVRLALTAAETGHLVLSTLHSGNAAMTIERVLDAFEDSEKLFVRQQLAGVLRAVVAQQLLPAVAGGLHPVLEILTVNHAVAAQIREGRTHMLATQMELGAIEGMVPFPRALADLVRAGRVSRAAALAAAADPEAVQAALEARR